MPAFIEVRVPLGVTMLRHTCCRGSGFLDRPLDQLRPSKAASSQQVVGPWVLGIAIVVEPFARFSAVHAGHYHPLHQRRWCKALLPVFVEEDFCNVISGLNADVIEER